MTNHYDELGIPRDADDATIKAAYRKAAKANHPDRPGGNTEKMARVNRAYMVLSDPQQRERYDQTGRDDGAAPRSKEEKAQELLRRAIDIALEDVPEDQDMPAQIREGMAASRHENVQQIDHAKQAIKRLEKKIKQVRRKSGAPNMFVDMAQHKIGEHKQRIAMLTERNELIDIVFKLLDDYEACDLPPPAPPMDPNWYQGHIDAAYGGARQQTRVWGGPGKWHGFKP